MPKDSHLYYLINKPYRVLSQYTDEDGNKGLGRIYNLQKDVYSVGRLDLDSEGLLILTNDKALNHKLLNPKHEHQRTYFVEVDGVPTEKELSIIQNGVVINLKGKKHHTKSCHVEIMNEFSVEERNPPVNRIKHPTTSWLKIILTEGKNRQVRKMTAKIGHPTLRLIRYAIEDIELGKLPSGSITQISKKSIYKKLKIN